MDLGGPQKEWFGILWQSIVDVYSVSFCFIFVVGLCEVVLNCYLTLTIKPLLFNMDSFFFDSSSWRYRGFSIHLIVEELINPTPFQASFTLTILRCFVYLVGCSRKVFFVSYWLLFFIFSVTLSQIAVWEGIGIDFHFTWSFYNKLLGNSATENSTEEFRLVHPSLYAAMIKPLLVNDISTIDGFNDIPFYWESIIQLSSRATIPISFSSLSSPFHVDTVGDEKKCCKMKTVNRIFTLGDYSPDSIVNESNKNNFAQVLLHSPKKRLPF